MNSLWIWSYCGAKKVPNLSSADLVYQFTMDCILKIRQELVDPQTVVNARAGPLPSISHEICFSTFLSNNSTRNLAWIYKSSDLHSNIITAAFSLCKDGPNKLNICQTIVSVVFYRYNFGENLTKVKIFERHLRDSSQKICTE